VRQIKRCKPAIVPYGFNIPEHYEDALLTYKSPDELVHLILKFMNGYGEDINSKIYQSFSFFVKENFLVHFERLMKINTTSSSSLLLTKYTRSFYWKSKTRWW